MMCDIRSEYYVFSCVVQNGFKSASQGSLCLKMSVDENLNIIFIDLFSFCTVCVALCWLHRPILKLQVHFEIPVKGAQAKGSSLLTN